MQHYWQGFRSFGGSCRSFPTSNGILTDPVSKRWVSHLSRSMNVGVWLRTVAGSKAQNQTVFAGPLVHRSHKSPLADLSHSTLAAFSRPHRAPFHPRSLCFRRHSSGPVRPIISALLGHRASEREELALLRVSHGEQNVDRCRPPGRNTGCGGSRKSDRGIRLRSR